MAKNQTLVKYVADKTYLNPEEVKMLDNQRFIEIANKHFKNDYNINFLRLYDEVYESVSWVIERLINLHYMQAADNLRISYESAKDTLSIEQAYKYAYKEKI